VVAADAVVAVAVDGCEDDGVLHGMQFFFLRMIETGIRVD
jgi:hypothetical protein